MSFEKAKAYLKDKGLEDHIIVLNESSATVAEAAHALGVEPASIAKTLSGFMTDAVLNNISLVGNILIFCVGINLVWPKTIKVANLLPSLLVAIVMTLV